MEDNSKYIGKHLLVGLTYEDENGEVTKRLQVHGEITKITGQKIHLERSEELPPVLIDQEAIALAVINLLDNAVKYGGQTPVELELTAKRSTVDVAVRDHGPGIPADSLRRVFERFYRGPDTNPTRGSGIGLALVKNIAQAHGGRAWAKNAAGGGAVVGFSIPIAHS